MIRTIIIDDEPLACSLLEEMLQAYPQIKIEAVCYDGISGLEKIQEFKPDLIFLDIQMPKITGIEMLELLEDPPAVIFTTAYDEYAIKAFEMNAVDYLLKPYSAQRLKQGVERILENNKLEKLKVSEQTAGLHTAESSARVVVKDGHIIKIIPTKDVLYIEAASDYVKIFTKDKYYLKHGTMAHFEQVLAEKNFIRVHRSFIVNTSYIHSVELQEKGGHCVVLQEGQIVPVSKAGYSRLKAFLT